MTSRKTLRHIEEYLEDSRRTLQTFDAGMSGALNRSSLTEFNENSVKLTAMIQNYEDEAPEIRRTADELASEMEAKTGLSLIEGNIAERLLLQLNQGKAVDKEGEEQIRARMVEMVSREESIFTENMIGVAVAVGSLI